MPQFGPFIRQKSRNLSRTNRRIFRTFGQLALNFFEKLRVNRRLAEFQPELHNRFARGLRCERLALGVLDA